MITGNIIDILSPFAYNRERKRFRTVDLCKYPCDKKKEYALSKIVWK